MELMTPQRLIRGVARRARNGLGGVQRFFHAGSSGEREPTVAELKQQVAKQAQELYWHRHPGFMHYTLGASTAKPLVVGQDQAQPRTRKAVERVIAAFHCAKENGIQNAPSLWDNARNIFYNEFIQALEERNVDVVQNILGNAFCSTVIWGTARMHWTWPAELRERPTTHYMTLRLTDMLCSLAEAVGAKRIGNIEQCGGFDGYCKHLQLDLEKLLRDIEAKSGLNLDFPKVSSAMGVTLNGKFLTLDSVIHSYTLYRLQQLAAKPADRIVEIGGGYGCMAYLFARAGFKDFTVIDLPWQNAIQGYFLINTLPDDAVALYGETSAAPIKVMPTWSMHDLQNPPVDFYVNVNSLPEIGLEDARQYLATIARTVRKWFVSINQEAGAQVPGVGEQGCVAQLAAETGKLNRVSRSLWWMDQGYAEELFQPR